MAGHSQFKNIMHRKGAQDAKRAKKFTKISREIITSVRIGQADPNFNPRLRAAIAAARDINMPKDKIEAAIKRGSTPNTGDDYEEMHYEGFGPGGIAVIVEALTDNRNRTASEVRSAFTKYGGNLGETGSVNYLFDHIGLIIFPQEVASEQVMLEAAIEAGANECFISDSQHVIYCEKNLMHDVRTYLTEKFGEPDTAKLYWLAKDPVEISEETSESVQKFITMLEDNDDIQEVYTNVA